MLSFSTNCHWLYIVLILISNFESTSWMPMHPEHILSPYSICETLIISEEIGGGLQVNNLDNKVIHNHI